MTTKLPSICCGRGGVSSILLRPQYTTTIRRITPSRHNSNQTNPPTDDIKPERIALLEIQGHKPLHPVNPPRSTLPPPLNLPERDQYPNVFLYYLKLGRTYGKFYLTGIKAVWFNRNAAKIVQRRLLEHGGDMQSLKRSEFQLLARNRHDIGKLPFFGVLVALFGEWLPLLVPFIPGVVPGTCRIPKQIEKMRLQAEERRRVSFRRGIEEPSVETAEGKKVQVAMQYPQMLHLSSTLNAHSRWWEKLNFPPPPIVLNRAVQKQLGYLMNDDFLLRRDGGAEMLSDEEVVVACEERGIDVLGKPVGLLRRYLVEWLDGRVRGDMFVMLFRRPNAWNTQVNAPKEETPSSPSSPSSPPPPPSPSKPAMKARKREAPPPKPGKKSKR